nr:hypothetical protein [Tanacetum cinerariifolium]
LFPTRSSHREDRPEVTLPPRTRLCIALGPRYEVGESSSAAAARPAGGLKADYGFMRDRRAYVYTHHLMETEARLSREAWMTEIRELHAVDRRRQIVILEMLRADHRRSTEIIGLRTALQGQVTVLQGQVIALQTQVTALQGQQGLVGGPTQPELPELPEEAG